MAPTRVPVLVFGGPGGGEVAAQILGDVRRSGGPLELRGYLNDRLPSGQPLLDGRVLGPFRSWVDQPEETCFVAPLHKLAEMQARLRAIEALGIPDSRWARVVHPSAAVAGNVQLAEGTLVGSHTTIQPGARLGSHVALRHGVMVGHDSCLERFVFVGGNTTLCGRAYVEEGAYLAPGSLVREDVRIGRFATVGLGAVVLRDVEPYSTVVGNPARLLSGTPRS
ncbi:MAG: acetyltransferase [Myxococcota bacterium]